MDKVNKIKLNFLCCYFLFSLFSASVMAETFILPDPTRPPQKVFTPLTVKPKEPLKLSAIFIYPNYRFAIINGTVLKTGDRIGEFTITSINPYNVELIGSQNEKETLELNIQVKQSSDKDVR